LWQEALETGQKVHPLTEETLNKHMQGPIIIEDERNNGGNQQVCSCLAAWPVFLAWHVLFRVLCVPIVALSCCLSACCDPVAYCPVMLPSKLFS